MNTFSYSGHRIPWTNSTGSAVASGALVIVRSGASGVCGIAVTDIANGSTGEVEISGVHTLTASTGAWAQGALVYRNASTGALTGTASGATLAGFSPVAKTTAATTGLVVLNANPGR